VNQRRLWPVSEQADPRWWWWTPMQDAAPSRQRRIGGDEVAQQPLKAEAISFAAMRKLQLQLNFCMVL